MFEMTPGISELGNFQQSAYSVGFVKFFKFIVGITSTNADVTVHVDVVEFTIPKISAKDSEANKATTNENKFYTTRTINGVEMRIPMNYFTYDYIFTGRNKDILNMDVKIQNFQMLLAANLKVGPGALAQVSQNSGEYVQPDQVAKDLLNARPYDAILLPLDSEASFKAFSQIAKTITTKRSSENQEHQQQYLKNLSMFYAASPIVVSMTIRGNPFIMHKFNMGVTLDTLGAITAPTDRKQYRLFLDNLLKKNFSQTGTGKFAGSPAVLNDESYVTSPVFVHLNIMGPAVDDSTGTPLKGKYVSSVLSDNYYAVFKVTNNIQGHTFTQDLELYSHNIFGVAKDAAGSGTSESSKK
jgi:hypothetical protein